jgi:flagellar operon protein
MGGVGEVLGAGRPEAIRSAREERKGTGNKGGPSFRDVLEETGLRFSRHAAERLERREIPLEKGDLRRVERAVAAAERKGTVQSLVLVGDAALIVNLPTRNVISAFHRAKLKDGIFTRIDSAVVVERPEGRDADGR